MKALVYPFGVLAFCAVWESVLVESMYADTEPSPGTGPMLEGNNLC